jgi:hypothetical protein
MKSALFSAAHALLVLVSLSCGIGCSETETDKPGDDADELPSEGSSAGECDDGADNDQDGDYDCNDVDCAGAPDCSEANTPGGCGDGADNDRDGLFDCDDPDCAGLNGCGDAVEGNDPGDCADTVDNDGDGAVDCADPDCGTSADCDDYEGDEAGECADGADNDGNGAIDCDDTSCTGAPDCENASIDADGDGVMSDADCNDEDASVYPGAQDRFTDGVDQDCDGADGIDCSVLNYTPVTDPWGQGDYYVSDTSDPCADGYNAVQGGLYFQALSLSDLDRFWCICKVGGRPGSSGLFIGSNSNLHSIEGLRNIRSIGGNVTIRCNPQLDPADVTALIYTIGTSNIGGDVFDGYNKGQSQEGC